MPYIIFLLALAFSVSLIFARRERVQVPYNRMQKAEWEGISKLICDFCIRSKTSDSGKGINPPSLMVKIRRANAIIGKRIRNGKIITESEKWLYENYYLIYRYVYARKDDMKSLPHINGVPRMIAIAKIIVNNSLGILDGNRVKDILNSVNGRVSLSYPEMRQLNNAFYYALTEQAYILSDRLLNRFHAERRAKRFNINYLNSDVYVHFLFKNNILNARQTEYLDKRGITERRATVNYNCSVLYDADVAKTIFTGFREVDSYVPADMNVRYLGAYKVLDKDFDLDLSVNTLRDYFTVISEVGSSTGADEDYVAEKATLLAKNNGLDISDVLFDYKKELKKAVRTGSEITLKEKNTTFGQNIYALSIFLAAAASAAAVAVFFDLAVGILSFLPFVFIAENLINYALHFLVENKNPPEMNFKTVPHNHRTAVVVSEFISSASQFAESYGHVRKLRASNGGENVSFCLLVDTKGGERPVSKLDEEIIEYVKTQGKEEDICVFLRKKTFINGVYCGKERKRGALNALNKYFVTGNGSEFSFISNENIFQPKYIVTLDSDNSLLTGDVTEMVNIIAHPYNKKYDIMALHSRYDLYSLKTGYSLRFCDECGIEEYPVYSDLFYRAFGRDIYCGKGIYRVNAFYRKTDDVFPSGRILSHDVIEGAVMTTGGGTTVLEDAPNGFLSDRERKKRWMRGDIQLLPFVAGRWRNDDNKKCKVEIAPLYKYVIFRNALSVMKPLFIFASLFYGLLSGVETLVFVLGLFIAPYVLDLVKILRGYSMGTRFRYLMKNAAKKFLTAIEDFFLSGYYAVDNTILFVQTIFRMISGRNLLNWKTYHDSQADKKSGEYVKEFAVPTAVLCAIGLVLVFFYTNTLFLALYIIASFFFYYELYLFSKTKLYLRRIDDCDRKKLLEYAEKTYKYFTYMLSYGPLVADNLQIKPYKGISSTTSPTNIGFSLLANICAYELGFVKIDDCLEAMSKIIKIAEKLPKWKGNLYNWYDLNGNPVNSFVSSVDSGNFLASLIICREFFAERGDDVNELKTELLIINTDIAALYDEGKNMFYIGYDGEKFVGHYDILNSESRILTTLYTAYAKNIKNFRCLQRDYCRYGGNTLLSWSGTAFETLMPALFIASPLNSALRNTEKNVSRVQSSVKINGIWGISESGYYDFDENLKYQYYAFGIKRLSLKNEYTVPIISPYASALCLEYLPKETINNFNKLASCGAIGEYGFYEAVDMRKERRIVCSHMSHHQGMILCAITNYLRDNKLKKLFSSDDKIAASLKNLNEIVPKGNAVQFLGERPQKQLKYAQEYYKNVSNLEEYFQTFILFDADYSSVFTAFGGGYLKKSDIYINKFFNIYEENQGGFFYIKNEDGEIYSPTFLPLSDQCKYNVTSTGNEIVFENTTKSAIQKVALMNGLNGEVRYLSCKEDNCDVAFYLSVALNSSDGYISHPTYNGLFISATVCDNVLIMRNRRKRKDGKDYVLGVRVEGLEGLSFECNDKNFIGRNGSLSAPNIFSGEKYAPSVGDVIDPCVGFVGKMRKNSCAVALIFGEDADEVVATLKSLPDDLYTFALLSDGKSSISAITEDILSELLFVPYANDNLLRIEKNGEIKQFMQKTKGKKIILYKFSENNSSGFDMYLQTLFELKLLGIDYKSYVETCDDFSVKNYVSSRLAKAHICGCEIVSPDERMEKYAFIVLNPDMQFKRTKFYFNEKYKLQKIEEENYFSDNLSVNTVLYRSGSGGFDENDSYVVDGNTCLPYSNVIAAENGGMLTTENGGGFFYFGNSRENKMNRFDNDPVTDDFSEFLYVKTSSGCHRVNSGSGRNRFAVFDRGRTVFVSKINGLTCTVKYTTAYGGRARIISVDSINRGGYAEFVYGFFPALGWKYEPFFIFSDRSENIITVTNATKEEKLFIKVLSDAKRELTFTAGKIPFFEYFVADEECKFHIVFSQDESLIKSLNAQNLIFYEEKEQEYFDSFENPEIASKFRSFNVIARWLPYQIMSSRVNGRLGFYQVGGASGFRDRLQDALAIMHFAPEKSKEIIVESAKRQYLEGDVMHWWHNPKFGLRTKITDDKLFLPLVTAEYVEFTGDLALLDMELPYLNSPVLAECEKTRYENPPYTDIKESLLKHCLKAVKSSLRYGEHGLLIMGGGDWNDGMDEICGCGKGESVFNSMLAYEAMRKIARFCNEEKKNELLRIAEELKSAINSFAFDKDRYMRLYSDDGVWYGNGGNPVLDIDILTQSYAVISGVATSERAETVLKTAEKLIDYDNGIIKLLSPPLKENSNFGYISAYPEGVRENGGQYTHAAMWYLIALTEIGRQDDAFELFMKLNPVNKLREEEVSAAYGGEPYVLSGDVYTNAQNYGRMGWSWYTGSAGWAYRLIVEGFFGLKRKGKKLYINPRLPKKLSSSVVTYRYGESVYSIEYETDKTYSVELNGELLAENYVTLERGTLKKVKVTTP